MHDPEDIYNTLYTSFLKASYEVYGEPMQCMASDCLSDKKRSLEFIAAALSAVREGDKVLDAGAGLLTLSYPALIKGASEVVAVECNRYLWPVIDIMKKDLCLDNLVIRKEDASDTIETYRPDLFMTETFDTAGNSKNEPGAVLMTKINSLYPGIRTLPDRMKTRARVLGRVIFTGFLDVHDTDFIKQEQGIQAELKFTSKEKGRAYCIRIYSDMYSNDIKFSQTQNFCVPVEAFLKERVLLEKGKEYLLRIDAPYNSGKITSEIKNL